MGGSFNDKRLVFRDHRRRPAELVGHADPEDVVMKVDAQVGERVDALTPVRNVGKSGPPPCVNVQIFAADRPAVSEHVLHAGSDRPTGPPSRLERGFRRRRVADDGFGRGDLGPGSAARHVPEPVRGHRVAKPQPRGGDLAFLQVKGIGDVADTVLTRDLIGAVGEGLAFLVGEVPVTFGADYECADLIVTASVHAADGAGQVE